MTYMESVAAGVREHIEHVKLSGLGIKSRIAGIGGAEGIGIQPLLLPTCFEFGKGIVLAGKGHLVRTMN